MKRRQALRAVCAAVAGAGCLDGGPSRPTTARLAWIWLRNDRASSFDVDVVVEDGGERVFARSYELGTTPDTATVHAAQPVDGPGRYVVRATMDGETRAVDTTDVVDGDEPCVGVRFSLLDNGSVDYWTKATERCGGRRGRSRP